VRDLSSHRFPVYKRFLTGGPESLRLSPKAVALVAGCGAALLAIRLAGWMTCSTSGLGGQLTAAVAAIVTALLVAGLAGRWLGNQLGLLAGLVQLSGLHVLGGFAAAAEAISGAAVASAMGAFALANVPGRLPPGRKPWVAWAFYAGSGVSLLAAGPIGPATILAGCLLFLLANQDARGLRFFASPTAAGLFVLVVLAWLLGEAPAGPTAWQGDWLRLSSRSASPLAWRVFLEPALLILPWTPLVVLAVVVGFRGGHYATPIWRFLGCWVLGSIGVGLLGDVPYTAATLPPLAIIGAAGLWQSLAWCRRRPQRTRPTAVSCRL